MSRTWTGAVSTAMSQPGNWSPAGVPAADDPLLFAGNWIVNNDLPSGTSLGPIRIFNTLTLNGNALTLTQNIENNADTFVCNAALKIGAAVTISGNGGSGASSTYNGPIDVNGQTFTITTLNTTVKSLSGTGLLFGGALTIAADGTFSGTIEGNVDMEGSLPNATIANAPDQLQILSGNATLGDVTTSRLYPGTRNPFYYALDPYASGTINMKSLTLQPPNPNFVGANLFFDVNPSGPSDLIHVSGSVNLVNAGLFLSLGLGKTTPGQTFTIIQNDGTDPINGIFGGYPEGTTISLDGLNFTISYHGGDGNDVVLTATNTSKAWVGHVSNLWSNPNNWNPASIPTPDETLVFYDAATLVNDLPAGTAVGPLHIYRALTLTGNPLTLNGDITVETNADYSSFLCNVDLKLGAPVRTSGGGIAGVTFNGAIDVNGQSLTIGSYKTTVKSLNGSGQVHGDFIASGDGTFSGTIDGNVDVEGSMPGASIHATSAEFLAGNGIVGETRVALLEPGTRNPSTDTLVPQNLGTLKTRTLSLEAPGGEPGAFFDLSGLTSDKVQVTGTVSLNNATLNVTVSGGTTWGSRYLLIDNDWIDPVIGTFKGLPEGSVVVAGGSSFRITYAGGDGNDVELIVATTTSADSSQNATASVAGEPVKLTATLVSGSGPPTGSVTFTDNGNFLGTAVLVNGAASLDVSSLSPGQHSIVATYPGAGAYLGSAASPLLHTVNRGGTTTTLGAATARYGETSVQTLTAVVAPAAGNVTGTVTLSETGQSIASASVTGGTATISAPLLKPGSHTLAASYSGSALFIGSLSGAINVTIDPALVQLDVSTDGSLLKVMVYPFASVPEIPAGTVTITEKGAVVAQQPIAGSANVSLALGPGHHTLHVGYSGDQLFQQAGKDIDVEVAGTVPSRHRGVHH